jgi:hypothetical protein
MKLSIEAFPSGKVFKIVHYLEANETYPKVLGICASLEDAIETASELIRVEEIRLADIGMTPFDPDNPIDVCLRRARDAFSAGREIDGLHYLQSAMDLTLGDDNGRRERQRIYAEYVRHNADCLMAKFAYRADGEKK